MATFSPHPLISDVDALNAVRGMTSVCVALNVSRVEPDVLAGVLAGLGLTPTTLAKCFDPMCDVATLCDWFSERVHVLRSIETTRAELYKLQEAAFSLGLLHDHEPF